MGDGCRAAPALAPPGLLDGWLEAPFQDSWTAAPTSPNPLGPSWLVFRCSKDQGVWVRAFVLSIHQNSAGYTGKY